MHSVSLIKFICNYTQEDVNKGGIYLIKCHANNALYVGQTRFFINRWLQHQGSLYKNKRDSYIQHAYNKYGISTFEFVIQEFLPKELQEIAYKYKSTDDEYLPVAEWLNKKEKYYIAKYREELGERKVFNYTTGGDHPQPNKELREKRSVASKNTWQNKEYRDLLKEKIYNNDECLLRISNKQKENWKNHNFRNKVITSVKIAFSKPEYREKRSNIAKQNMQNEELRKCISNTMKENWKKDEYIKMQKESRTFYKDNKWRKNVSKGIKKKFELDKEYHNRNVQNAAIGRSKSINWWNKNINYILMNFLIQYEEIIFWSTRRKRKLVRLCTSEIKKNPSLGKMDSKSVEYLYNLFLERISK